MKKVLLILLLLLCTAQYTHAQENNQQFYALRTYSLSTDEQLTTTEDFLEHAFLPALKRMDIGPVGVFKPVKPKDSLQQIFVLIPFNDLNTFQSLSEKLAQDNDFNRQGGDYLDAKADQPPYARISTVLLKAFPDMPQLRPSAVKGDRNQRIYELRSYQSPNETYFASKKEMFNAGGEITLFDQLDFNAVFYSEVLAGPDMPNLMYMVTFKNEADRDAHWKAFGDSPVWKKLNAQPKYQDNVSHIDNIYLYPTPYSEY